MSVLLAVACAPSWTRAELAAAQLVGVTEHVVDDALAHDCRTDQASNAAQAARALAALLAHPWPSRDDLDARLVVLDASLLALTYCPALRPNVRRAQAAVLQLRQEIGRRRHGPFGRPYRVFPG